MNECSFIVRPRFNFVNIFLLCLYNFPCFSLKALYLKVFIFLVISSRKVKITSKFTPQLDHPLYIQTFNGFPKQKKARLTVASFFFGSVFGFGLGFRC